MKLVKYLQIFHVLQNIDYATQEPKKEDVDNAGHAKVWTVVGADIVWIRRSLVDTTG